MFSVTDVLLDSVDLLDHSFEERGNSDGFAIYGDPIADGADLHLMTELPAHFPQLFVRENFV